MSHEFLDYVEDILDAMEKAQILVHGVTYEQFAADFRINFAVVRALEIIGEATKRLPIELRDRYSDIPWKEMAGMRDKIIHAYDTVYLRIVWETLKQRIPAVQPRLQKILIDYEGQE